MFASVDLLGDSDDDEQRDEGEDDVDEPEVDALADDLAEELGHRVEDAHRDEVEAGQGRQLGVPLEEKKK